MSGSNKEQDLEMGNSYTRLNRLVMLGKFVDLIGEITVKKLIEEYSL